MANPAAFRPRPGASKTLATTTTTGRTQVQTTLDSPHVRIFNAGSETVFVEIGDATVTAATATGMPIGANTAVILACSHTHIAAICATGTANVYVTPGYGGS